MALKTPRARSHCPFLMWVVMAMLHFTMAESVVEVDGVDGFLMVVVFVREMLVMGSICREQKQRLWNDLMRRAKRICMSKLDFFWR